jgi:putative PIN family toxin of toxin-antitoxin system
LAAVRIVLDTNILVRANPIASPKGLARDLLLAAVSRPQVLILSRAILIEVQRVLAYPHVQARWPLSQAAIEQYLNYLEAVSLLVETPAAEFPILISDPDDDPILQTAISGRADVLCTRDEAFRHPLVVGFAGSHNIRIIDDVSLMRELRSLA